MLYRRWLEHVEILTVSYSSGSCWAILFRRVQFIFGNVFQASELLTNICGICSLALSDKRTHNDVLWFLLSSLSLAMWIMDGHLAGVLQFLCFHVQTADPWTGPRSPALEFQKCSGQSPLCSDTWVFGSADAWTEGFVLRWHRMVPSGNEPINNILKNII